MLIFIDTALLSRVIFYRGCLADVRPSSNESARRADMQEQQHAGQERVHPEPHVIHYSVGDEPQTTTERTLTAHQIMANAGINPDENYLVEILGRERKSFKDTPNDPIHMHEGQRFVVVFVGPVPVS